MTAAAARFFVPKLPLAPNRRGRYARADWRQWVAQLRAFAVLNRIERIPGPCRVEIAIWRPVAAGTPPPSDARRGEWTDGVRAGLVQARLVGEVYDVTIRSIVDLPSWSNEGGVEIEITPTESER